VNKLIKGKEQKRTEKEKSGAPEHPCNPEGRGKKKDDARASELSDP